MKVLKNVLEESRDYYLELKKKIERKIKNLPKGSIKERKIYGGKYYYLQYRQGKKVIHKYLGKNKPEKFIKQIKERKALLRELKEINEALKLINRTKKRKRK